MKPNLYTVRNRLPYNRSNFKRRRVIFLIYFNIVIPEEEKKKRKWHFYTKGLSPIIRMDTNICYSKSHLNSGRVVLGQLVPTRVNWTGCLPDVGSTLHSLFTYRKKKRLIFFSNKWKRPYPLMEYNVFIVWIFD